MRRQVSSEPNEQVDIARLYATTDATVWAKEFVEQFKGHTVVERGVDSGVSPTVDKNTMVGWFANAIETAKDSVQRDDWLAVGRDRYAHDPIFHAVVEVVVRERLAARDGGEVERETMVEEADRKHPDLMQGAREMPRLRGDALEGMEDMRSYVPTKWDHDGYIARLRALVAALGDGGLG
jgi:hypothetical protein